MEMVGLTCEPSLSISPIDISIVIMENWYKWNLNISWGSFSSPPRRPSSAHQSRNKNLCLFRLCVCSLCWKDAIVAHQIDDYRMAKNQRAKMSESFPSVGRCKQWRILWATTNYYETGANGTNGACCSLRRMNVRIFFPVELKPKYFHWIIY